MLPATSAMPGAGRITPKTSQAGILITPMQRPVRVSTLTRTLTPKPKKALVSPAYPVGSLAVVGRISPDGSDHWGIGDPAEDAALCGDHLQPTRWNSGK
jgi:hypothetical protein